MNNLRIILKLGTVIQSPEDEIAVTDFAFNLCVLYYKAMSTHFRKLNPTHTPAQEEQKEVSI